jgi:hypothetical protein
MWQLTVDEVRRISDEMSALSCAQHVALQIAPYALMSLIDHGAFDTRRGRIAQLCGMLVTPELGDYA